VKVAYLLVTTACLLGAQAPGGPPSGGGAVGPGGTPPKAGPVVPGPVSPTPVAPAGDCGCNNNTCDNGCGSSGWGRFKEFCSGLCRRHDSCDSCGGCATARPSCFTAPSCGCKTQSAPSCNTCNEGCGTSCCQRIKEYCGKLFHRNHDCCDTCNSCGGTVIVPKGAEPIPAPKDGTSPPKEMPKGPGAGEPPQKQVQIINPAHPLPVPAPTFDAPPAAPAITPANPTQERPF
jgi:hypothetical protein